MHARLACPTATLLALALFASASGATAKTRHRAAAHHLTTHHAAAHHKSANKGRTERRHKDRPVEHRAAPPGVAIGVPSGGLKLSCPPRKNPLLIRKATQGAGTTVTVVCR